MGAVHLLAPVLDRVATVRIAAIFSLLVLAGCNGRASAPDPETPTPEPTVSETAFVEGPALTPAADLLAWFEGEGEGKLVQVPVVVTPSPLGIGGGHVGGSASAPAEGALHLKLDDTAMSVSLADRLRADCSPGAPCAIWVEGIWGATVPNPSPSELGLPPGPSFGPEKHPFSVRRYVGPVQGEVTHIRVSAG